MSKKNHPPAPPKLAEQLLKAFAGRADLEDLKGDLDELYLFNRNQSGRLKADLNYWKNALSLVFSYGLKKRKKDASYTPYYTQNSMAMFKNYFKIALRNFSKHKFFTSLNIFGLALGMSISLIALTMTVAVYLLDEFHEKKERIYQINTQIIDDQKDSRYSSTFHATADHLKSNYPFIEAVVPFHTGFNPSVNHHGQDVEFKGYFAGEDFFDVFSFELTQGNPQTALKDPFSLILTEKAAKKLFRDDDPIGQAIETDLGTFNVTGVMKDLHQTHFYFEMLTAYSTYRSLAELDLDNDWINFRNNYTYALLREGTSKDQLYDALGETSAKASVFHPQKKITLSPIEVSDIVPIKWNVSNPIGVGWDQPALVFFVAMGILILMPAIFNHTNLTIARSLQRAKEIGIRKVLGVQKEQIKAQFIVETILMALVALVLSFWIMVPMKEGFLDMVYYSEVVDTDLNIYQGLVYLGFTIVVGFFAGLFPAKYFARLNPLQTLKGDILNAKNGASGYKKGLFIFQFFLSLVFIIGVAVIGKQYRYVLNSDHGFESDNMLSIPFNGIDQQILINELGMHPNVTSVTASSNLPGIALNSSIEGTSNGQDTMVIKQVFVQADFIENMHIELAWGDSESIKKSNQSEELILANQQLIKSSKVFKSQGDSLQITLADGTNCRISGILKDFNFEPLTESIEPMIIRHSLEKSNYAILNISSSNMKQTIFELEEIWRTIDQNKNFAPTFLDDEIEEAYFIMMAQIKFFSVLSVLAITISCLGLLGMVSYTTENRTKEIAVRKIMGATNPSLYFLLTKDFLKLIGIAALIAVPFSYVFYDKLFLYFLLKYRTGLGAIEILISIAFLFLVGISAIYWQTAKVTKANPASKLRYE